MRDKMTFFLTKILAFLTILTLIPVSYGIIGPSFLVTLVILTQIGTIFIVRKFKPLALFFIFIFPYTYVAFAHYVFKNMPLTLAYTQFDNENYYTKVLVIHSLFLSVLTLMIPLIRAPFILKDALVVKNRPVVFYFILSLMIFIIIFGRSGTSIFESGGYGSADANIQLGGGIAIFEYFLILLPLAYIYTNKGKLKLTILLAVAVFFCIKGLLFGGRIETLQCFLLIFILYIDKAELRLSKVIFIGIGPVIFFIVFGFIRSTPNINMAELTSLLADNYKYSIYTLFGNHIDIYYSSTRLYGFVQEGVLTFQDRIYTFLLNILAIIVPYGKLPDIANLAAYKQSEYQAGGGGFISMFCYVFLSYPGVILAALTIGFVIKAALEKPGMHMLLYVIMVLCTYPRWFGYSPNVIYKLSFYIIPLYFIMNFFNQKKVNL
jgi:hypothetical protein